MEQEIWKDIKDFEGIYSVSNFGRIRRDMPGRATFAGRIKKFIKHNGGGYSAVTLSKNGKNRLYIVHKIVAEAFIGKRPDGFEVNHKDGNKENCRWDNLEYITHNDNMEHAKAHNLIHKGERCHNNKYKKEIILQIRDLHKTGKYKHKQIAEMFNIPRNTVTGIICRTRWKHI